MMSRFKFGLFLTEKIVVAEPLQNILSQFDKFEKLNKTSNILCKIKKLKSKH